MATANGQLSPPTQLEEDVEFSNVTALRESLLGRVESLRENPAKRYIITKHGQPQAVLMSFQTYSLLKRVMDQALARTATRNSSEAISAAIDRLRSENEDKFAEPAQTGAAANSGPAEMAAFVQVAQKLVSEVERLNSTMENLNLFAGRESPAKKA